MASRFREAARHAGVGRLLWRWFYKPTAGYRWLAGFGAVGACRFLLGNAAMRRAARCLNPLPAFEGAAAFACSFMTGHRHWHQTAFCAYSLAHNLPQGLRPTFFDDGSLRPGEAATLKRIFPGTRLVLQDEILDALATQLPANRFPHLRRAARATMMRKLIGIRIASRGWQLYLDSDMLFFQRPGFLESCAAETRACYMHDHGEGFYIRPVSELSRICGQSVPSLVNAGIVGIDDAQLDWERIEHWCANFRAEELDSALFEQTLTAMILAGFAPAYAPPADYAIVYQSGVAFPSNAVLLHYLFRSKLDYVTREWRRLPATDK